MNRQLVMATLAAALLAGCGDDDDKDDGGRNQTVHCLFTGDFCDQVTGSMTTSQRNQLSAGCSEAGAVFAEGACPTAGAVAGYCRYTGDLVTAITGVPISGAVLDEYYYTAGEWTPENAQAWCETEPAGTWVP